MPPMFRIARCLLALAGLAMAALPAPTTARAAGFDATDCRIGAYRLDDGSIVDIAPSEGETLRWRRLDGTTGALSPAGDGPFRGTIGWTGRPDGVVVSFTSCAERGIRFAGRAGRKIDFDTVDTEFRSGDVTLAGRLVLPRGDAPAPLVVLVHGSERNSARRDYALQRLLPAMGIGAFVYDKRGTGGSGGRYTQNFLLLAGDAIAAANEARRLAGARASEVGYQAGSQGGWVAPLAARIAPVDFVIVGFGLAVSPADEEREAIAYGLTRHGFGAEAVARSMDFAEASIALIGSNFEDGHDALAAARRRHADAPWLRYVRGDVTHIFLGMSEAELRRQGPALFAGIPLDYDPMPVLRGLEVPQLWILGADDIDAPSGETARRLEALAAAGRPITLAVFPDAEHGIYQYETAANGERLSTRQPEGYLRMMRDYILTGRLSGDYGARVSETLLRQAR